MVFIRDSLVAIDECHCVSSWAEFRSDYKELYTINEVKDKYNRKFSTLALTATATPKIISDITKVLKLNKPNIIMSSFYRENLNINVIKKIVFSLDI